MPRRRGGRRPGGRRDTPREQDSGRGGRGNPRGKKTQEELDAEMEDYFGGNPQPSESTNNISATSAAVPGAAAAIADDIDMIE